MKKLNAFVLALPLALSLVACSNNAATETAKAETAAKTTETSAAAGAGENAAAESPWEDGDTVTFEIGARAGGGTDMMVRYVTQALGELYPKVNFVVQNYDVAEVGLQAAANADPDGLTLTCVSVGNMSGYLAATSDTNPQEAFTIVAKFTPGGPQALVANVDEPFNTMEELADYIRANPKKINIGVSLGAVSHFSWLETLNAIDPELNNLVNYVQSGGEADKLTNIASKSLDLVNCSLNNAIAYETDGKLKVLASIGPEVATKEETEKLLNVSLNDNYRSLPEMGIDYSLNVGSYIAVPSSTDPAIVEALNMAFQKLNDNDTYNNGIHAMGSFTGVDDVATSQESYKAECDDVLVLMDKLGMNKR